MHHIASALDCQEDETPDTTALYAKRVQRLGIDKSTLEKRLFAMRALQSERAGVTGQHERAGESKIRHKKWFTHSSKAGFYDFDSLIAKNKDA